jgi:integrase
MQGHIHRRVHSMSDGRTTTTWYVIVDAGRDRNGRRRQKWHGGFRTRREAEAARAKIVNDLHNGTYIERSGRTLEEWSTEQWLPTMRSQVKPTTWDAYDRNMRLHILPTLGGVRLQDLTPARLNKLYAQLLETSNGRGGKLSAKTVRNLHTIVHKALADAVDQGLVVQNPAHRARPPKLGKLGVHELRFWTPEQLREFLAIVDGTRLEAAWHVAALTGMRRGEVLGLRWKDLDFDAARLSIRHTIVEVSYEVQSSTPKTHQARVIDLDPGTVERLLAHRERQAEERLEWGSEYEGNDLVFCRQNGSALHPQTFSQLFERMVARSPLPDPPA